MASLILPAIPEPGGYRVNATRPPGHRFRL